MQQLLKALEIDDKKQIALEVKRLGESGDPEALEVLMNLSNDSHPGIRYNARKAVQQLRKSLQHETADQKITYQFEKESIKKSPVKSETKSDVPEKEVTLKQPKINKDTLIKYLNSKNYKHRLAAVQGVSRTGDASVLDILANHIGNEPHEYVRSAIVKTLGTMGDQSVSTYILPYLKDTDNRVRSNAIEGLELCGYDNLLEDLVPLVSDNDNRVRGTALKVLAKFDQNKVIKHLDNMARSAEIWMRESALYVLYQLNVPKAMEIMGNLLLDDEKEIREKAEHYLKELNTPESMDILKKFSGKQRIKTQNSQREILDDEPLDDDEKPPVLTVKPDQAPSIRFKKSPVAEKKKKPLFAKIAFLLLLISGGVAYFLVLPKLDNSKIYENAKFAMETKNYIKAIENFEKIPGYGDSAKLLVECQSLEKKQSLQDKLDAGKYQEIYDYYKDSKKSDFEKKVFLQACYKLIEKNELFNKESENIPILSKLKELGEDESVLNDKIFQSRIAEIKRAIELNDHKKVYALIQTMKPEIRKNEMVMNLYMKSFNSLLDGFIELKEYSKAIEFVEKNKIYFGEWGKVNLYTVKLSGIYVLWGNESFQDNQFQPAINQFKEALNLIPDVSNRKLLVDAWMKWGDDSFLKEQYEKSLECYQQARSLEPDNSDAEKGIKSSKQELEKQLFANQSLEKIAVDSKKDYSSDPSEDNKKILLKSLERLIRRNEGSRDYEKVVEYSKDSLEVDPENEFARKSLFDAYIKLGDDQYYRDSFKNALDYYNKAEKVNPDSPLISKIKRKTRLLQANDYYKQADFPKAMSLLEEMVKEDPDYTDAKKVLGKCNYELGMDLCYRKKYEEGMVLLKKSLSLDPDNSEFVGGYKKSLFSLGQFYIKNREFEKALESFYQLQTLDPDNPQVKDEISRLYLIQAESKYKDKLRDETRLRAGQIAEEKKRLEEEAIKAAEKKKREREMALKANLYFEAEDPLGDDKGDGDYRYPDNRSIPKYQFDIKKMEVLSEAKSIVFRITMNQDLITRIEDSTDDSSATRGENRSDAGTQRGSITVNENGFAVNLFDIYIDTDNIPGSGRENALLGRNVRFGKSDCWDKVIVLSPMSSSNLEEALREKKEHPELLEMKKDIIFASNIRVMGNVIEAVVSEAEIGKPDSKWKYQLLSMGFVNDSDINTFKNMKAEDSPGRVSFGGGSNYPCAPAVIDLLTKSGTDQATLLKKYRPVPNIACENYAVIEMLKNN